MARQCGHVVCLNCVKKILVPSKGNKKSQEEEPVLCYVCDVPTSTKNTAQGQDGLGLPSGMVQLKSEGTGFSAHGSNTVEKSGVGFQC